METKEKASMARKRKEMSYKKMEKNIQKLLVLMAVLSGSIIIILCTLYERSREVHPIKFSFYKTEHESEEVPLPDIFTAGIIDALPYVRSEKALLSVADGVMEIPRHYAQKEIEKKAKKAVETAKDGVSLEVSDATPSGRLYALPVESGGWFYIDCPNQWNSSYMGVHTITRKSSPQYKWLQSHDWGYNEEGICTYNGRIFVALTSTFGGIGDYIDLLLADGTVLYCIKIDEKNVNDWNWTTYGHMTEVGSINVLELVVSRDWYNGHPNKRYPNVVAFRNYGKDFVYAPKSKPASETQPETTTKEENTKETKPKETTSETTVPETTTPETTVPETTTPETTTPETTEPETTEESSEETSETETTTEEETTEEGTGGDGIKEAETD